MAHPTIINRDLLATCWTSAGEAAPSRGDETSPDDLRTRIETAAEIGWEGFGLLHTDLAIAASTIGLQELRRIFEGVGSSTSSSSSCPGGGPPTSVAASPTTCARRRLSWRPPADPTPYGFDHEGDRHDRPAQRHGPTRRVGTPP
jgi:hypothetical protein